MNRILPLALVLAALACSTGREPPPHRTAEDDFPIEVPRSESLAREKMETKTVGPWTIRRTLSNSRRRGGERLADRLELKGDAPAEGAMSFGGGAAPEAEEEPALDAAPAPAAPPAPSKPGLAAEPASGSNGGAPLRAGTTDDNEKFEEFLAFLATWGDRPDTAGGYDLLDVRGRRFVRVVNRAGSPVPAARVTVSDPGADRVVLRATTYGDGRAPFYPRLDGPAGEDLVVRAVRGGVSTEVRWNGREDLTLVLEVPDPVTEPVPLDVLFLIDTTGSMGDEIDRIKASLAGVTEKLRALEREFDLRYAAVLYRDIGDLYVTKAHPFTSDLAAFDEALKGIRAAGGGDGPESLNQGLAEAVGHSDWREGAAKVMFLIADAPPHMDYEGDVPYGRTLRAALAKGIRIHSVAASGLPPVGSLVFRQIAQFTRGKFIFIEYGGDVAASGAAHGVAGAKKSNNLDDILFREIRDEVAHWGRGDEPDAGVLPRQPERDR